MRDLPDEMALVAGLLAAYGLDVMVLQSLPWGYDFDAAVYRVEADDNVYFLKIKAGPINSLSVDLPRYLQANGMESVVAPLPTINGERWGRSGEFALLLYPYIENTEADLTPQQWIAYGTALRQLHTTILPPDLLAAMPHEAFVPDANCMANIRRLHADVCEREYKHPLQRDLASFWCERHDEIGTIIDRTARLGQRLQGYVVNVVPCHSDIHIYNLMIDPTGRLFFVDWDQPRLAPPERDLMFTTVGGFVTDPEHERLFLQGYGPVEIDPLLMAYYRYERAMQDLAEFGEQVFAADTTAHIKADAAYWFKAQFAPQGLVEAAHRLAYVLEE